MEHVRTRNNSSPHPAEDPAGPLIQAYPSPSPSTLNVGDFDSEYPAQPSQPPSTNDSQFGDKPSPRQQPPFRGFEKPDIFRIAILTTLCLTTYPAFYILTLVAKDRSLFIVRLIVSTWCSGVGFALGYIILKTAAQHLEAATWSTVIHMSYNGGGMKLRDLARSTRNPTSFVPALHVFRSRFVNRETSRHSRKSYDKRPWSLFLVFFIILAALAPLLPFLFGRIMGIETFVRNQRKTYREVLIAGDVSESDVTRAGDQFLESGHFTRTWTLLPYGRVTSGTAEFVYGNDTVYFAQPSLSQFIPGGSGAGTFDQPELISLKDAPNNTVPLIGRDAPKGDTGVVLRYPQWGNRIHCAKLPNPEVNLIPLSSQNSTYIFLPQELLQDLFKASGIDTPPPFDESTGDSLDANDTIPSNIDPSTISFFVKLPHNGESITTHATIFVESDQTNYTGWTTVEAVLIRLNTSFTPSGRFPVYSNGSLPDIDGAETRIGYDAAVCVHKYEPWIIETYNTSIVSPSVMRIVEKGYGGTSSGIIRGAPIANTRYLNTTAKDVAFWVAYSNSLNRIVKDNDRGGDYVPTPTVVSYTEGTGPAGYVELSPERLAIVRGRVSAANTLPYLAGSGPLVAQLYADETVAYATYKEWQLISLPIVVWILGVIGELFVPRLPLNIPRREFGAYSWLALLQSQELRFEAADELDKFMSLDELEDKFSDKRIELVV